jgi:hydroxymethylbilane synthase
MLNQALAEIGGKGLFTKELDVALLERSVDICVHSMKDVPTFLAAGTILPCNLVREETNDVFVSKKYKRLADLPDGAVIGTASLRRQSQLLAMNPKWKVVLFRGNVQTRLKKLEDGVVDATLLALAGLKRLNMTELITSSEVIDQETILPAVAQGAIGIQCRVASETGSGSEHETMIRRFLDGLNHGPTKAAVDCERSFLAELDGNCRTPIAGQAAIDPTGNTDRLVFTGMISKPDGTDMIRVRREGKVAEAELIGRDAGLEIKAIAGPKKFQEYQQAVAEAQSANNNWKK